MTHENKLYLKRKVCRCKKKGTMKGKVKATWVTKRGGITNSAPSTRPSPWGKQGSILVGVKKETSCQKKDVHRSDGYLGLSTRWGKKETGVRSPIEFARLFEGGKKPHGGGSKKSQLKLENTGGTFWQLIYIGRGGGGGDRIPERKQVYRVTQREKKTVKKTKAPPLKSKSLKRQGVVYGKGEKATGNEKKTKKCNQHKERVKSHPAASQKSSNNKKRRK